MQKIDIATIEKARRGSREILFARANVDTTLNVYTQVLDGSVRAAAEKVGSELSTIVHNFDSAATARASERERARANGARRRSAERVSA